MKTDKDRPRTWIQYSDSLCEKCSAHCCTMPVEIKASDLVRLKLATEDEALYSSKKTFKKLRKLGYLSSYREGTEFFMLTQKPNGDCVFLDPQTRLCQVYDQRPDTCRDFPLRVGPRLGFCPYGKK